MLCWNLKIVSRFFLCILRFEKRLLGSVWKNNLMDLLGFMMFSSGFQVDNWWSQPLNSFFYTVEILEYSTVSRLLFSVTWLLLVTPPLLGTSDSADQRKFRRRTAGGQNYLCMTYSRALQGIGIPRIHVPSTPPKNKNKTILAGPHWYPRNPQNP